jgi:hypothetical protein
MGKELTQKNSQDWTVQDRTVVVSVSVEGPWQRQDERERQRQKNSEEERASNNKTGPGQEERQVKG